jgi:hypothetical protein
MRFYSALLLASTTLAAPTTLLASEDIKPFYLKVSSATNATLDSMSLFACHVGAAYEKLCIDKTSTIMSKPPTLGLNETYYAAQGRKSGNLIYNMPYNTNQQLWAGSTLSFASASGIAILQFGPSPTGDSDQYPLSFDANGVMNLLGASRWHVCRSSTNGSYHYEVLAWVYGPLPASNEGEECHPVTVTRVYPKTS